MVKIRRARPADFDSLMRLAYALQEHEASVEESVKATSRSKKALLKYEKANFERKDSRHFLAFEDGEIVGYISGWLSKSTMSTTGKPYGYICNCYVLEEHRRRGIGKALVAELVKWFVKMDVEHVELYAYVGNEAGKRFWDSVGFEPSMIKFVRKKGR